MENPQIFSTTVKVLVNDLNYGNHLGYDSLLNILQEARIRWLKTICSSISEINIENNIGRLVKDVHLTYESEANHGDELKITFTASNQTKISFTLCYEVENITTSKSLCSAETTLACFDYDKKKIARIPNILLSALVQLPTH